MRTETTELRGVMPAVLLLAAFSASCAGPPVQRTRIPAVSEMDWYRFSIEAIPCSVELPGKPAYHSWHRDGRVAQCKALFSFFDVQPPPGVLADAVSLLTLSIDSYTPDQFARLEAWLRESDVYIQADEVARSKLLWHDTEHLEVSVLESGDYIYVRRDLRTARGLIVSCNAEIRASFLLPVAKRMLESVQLTE